MAEGRLHARAHPGVERGAGTLQDLVHARRDLRQAALAAGMALHRGAPVFALFLLGALRAFTLDWMDRDVPEAGTSRGDATGRRLTST